MRLDEISGEERRLDEGTWATHAHWKYVILATFLQNMSLQFPTEIANRGS